MLLKIFRNTNFNYLKYCNNIYLHEICQNSIAVYNLSINQLLIEWLAELPTILEFFTGIANTTSTPIGWGMGG